LALDLGLVHYCLLFDSRTLRIVYLLGDIVTVLTSSLGRRTRRRCERSISAIVSFIRRYGGRRVWWSIHGLSLRSIGVFLRLSVSCLLLRLAVGVLLRLVLAVPSLRLVAVSRLCLRVLLHGWLSLDVRHCLSRTASSKATQAEEEQEEQGYYDSCGDSSNEAASPATTSVSSKSVVVAISSLCRLHERRSEHYQRECVSCR